MPNLLMLILYNLISFVNIRLSLILIKGEFPRLPPFFSHLFFYFVVFFINFLIIPNTTHTKPAANAININNPRNVGVYVVASPTVFASKNKPPICVNIVPSNLINSLTAVVMFSQNVAIIFFLLSNSIIIKIIVDSIKIDTLLDKGVDLIHVKLFFLKVNILKLILE